MALMVIGTLGIVSVPAAAAIEPAWVEETPLPGARVYAVIAADEAGLVYVCGGAINLVHETPTDTAFTYDPDTGAVAWLPTMPVGTRGGSSVVGVDGRLYVFTGYNDTAMSEIVETQIYDPVAESWSLGADIPIPMWGSRAQLGSDGLIYVMGGSDGSGTPRDSVQIYDPEADSWSAGAAMPVGTYHGVAITWGDYIFYLGGMTETMTVSDDVYYYSVYDDFWYTYTLTIPISRWGAAGCLSEDGLLFYVGGNDASSVTHASGVCLNIRTQTWIDLPDMGTARFYYSMVSLPDGRVMAFGGSDWLDMFDSVESMNVVDESIELSSSTVVQGGAVMLSLEADFAYTVPNGGYVEYYVMGADGTIYLYDGFDLPVWGPVSLELSLPDSCPAGDYILVITEYYLYEGWYSWALAENMELELTVTSGYTIEEQLAMLEANMSAMSDELQALIDAQAVEIGDLQDAVAAQAAEIAALQADLSDLADQLSTVEGDVGDLAGEVAALQAQLDALETTLAGLQESVDDVQTSVDGKADNTMLYAIIGLLVVVIVLLIVMMVMGRKAAPPPPAP